MASSTTTVPTKMQELIGDSKLMWGDGIVIAVYFLAVIGVAIWSSCRNRGSTQGYFLAGRSMHWIPIGASLFASNIGSGHFVGLAGSGASTGTGVAIYELSATLVLLLLGWVFVPVYVAAGVFTMPEYLRVRFGGQRIRVYLSVLSLILYVLTKIVADLYSGTVFLKQAIGLGIYPSAAILLVMAMIFSVAGGLTAVIWTDFTQTAIMLIGATALSILSFIAVGEKDTGFSSAYEALTNQFFAAYTEQSLLTNSSCGVLPDYSLKFMRPIDLGNDDLPWTGVIFGITISGIWYWCADQVIVQRTLAAKNISHARAGTILAGYLKFTPLFLLVMPGMAARILYPEVVGCANKEECMAACESESGCTNQAYPLLVLKLMPDGARGLMISVMLSALMSSLTSIFNSSSTLFTIDIYKRIRQHASETELLMVGRIFIVILVAVSIALLPIVDNFSQLFHYIQQFTSFLSPPVCAVYILALSWKRINEHGAFWGLMSGLLVGIIRFILQYLAFDALPGCGSNEKSDRPMPDIVSKVHYLHFGCILFLITAIVIIVVSLLTKPINPRKLIRLTYLSRDEPGERLDQDADDNAPEHLQELQSENFSSGNVVSNGSADYMNASSDNLTDDDSEKLPWYRIAVNWICGIEKQTAPELSDAEKAELEKQKLSIDEGKWWRRANSINAVILLVATLFMWGFYA